MAVATAAGVAMEAEAAIEGGIRCLIIIIKAFMLVMPNNPHPNTKHLPLALRKSQRGLGRGVRVSRHSNEDSVVDILDGLGGRGSWNVPSSDPGVICVEGQ